MVTRLTIGWEATDIYTGAGFWNKYVPTSRTVTVRYGQRIMPIRPSHGIVLILFDRSKQVGWARSYPRPLPVIVGIVMRGSSLAKTISAGNVTGVIARLDVNIMRVVTGAVAA